MPQMRVTVLLAGAVLLGLGTSAVRGQTSEVGADIKTTADTILKGGGPAAIQKAIGHLVELVARISMDGKLPEAVRTRLAAVRMESDAPGPVDAKSEAALREAYALLNGGKAFALPAEVNSIEALMAHGRGQVDRSVASLGRAKPEDAARELLGFILLVITPFDLGGGAPPAR